MLRYSTITLADRSPVSPRRSLETNSNLVDLTGPRLFVLAASVATAAAVCSPHCWVTEERIRIGSAGTRPVNSNPGNANKRRL